MRRIKGGTRLALTSCRAYLSVNLYLRAYVPPFKHSGRRDESWTREIQRMRLAMCQLVFNLWLPPRATGRADSPSLPLPVLLSVCRHYNPQPGPFRNNDRPEQLRSKWISAGERDERYMQEFGCVPSCTQCIRQSEYSSNVNLNAHIIFCMIFGVPFQSGFKHSFCFSIFLYNPFLFSFLMRNDASIRSISYLCSQFILET